jgi:hypothetical protein
VNVPDQDCIFDIEGYVCALVSFALLTSIDGKRKGYKGLFHQQLEIDRDALFYYFQENNKSYPILGNRVCSAGKGKSIVLAFLWRLLVSTLAFSSE